MTGYDFAQKLLTYINLYKDELDNLQTTLHKIDMNPEKSKHLETTTAKLYDYDIDFVNLRSEEYTENSRVPIMV